MARTRKYAAAAMIVSLSFVLSACAGSVRFTRPADSEVVVKSAGPPPHAPAHGYRHKHHHGVELVYRADIGVYVVVGRPAHYWSDGRYYRLENGGWQASARLDGAWKRIPEKKIPPGLCKKQVCKKGV